MTLLTFSTLKDKLLNFEKLKSLRCNAGYWVELLEKNPKLDMWWRNPRTKKYNPDCRKLGIAEGTAIYLYGYEFTLKTAIDDGFVTLYELLETLMDLHDIESEEVLEHRWAQISWEWVDTYWICACGDYIGEDREWGPGAMCGICESVDG